MVGHHHPSLRVLLGALQQDQAAALLQDAVVSGRRSASSEPCIISSLSVCISCAATVATV